MSFIPNCIDKNNTCKRPGERYEGRCAQHWKKHNLIQMDIKMKHNDILEYIKFYSDISLFFQDANQVQMLCKQQKSIYQIDPVSKQINKEYKSIEEIINIYNYDIHKFYLCLITYFRIHNGYIWCYKETYNIYGIEGIYYAPFKYSFLNSPHLIKEWDYELNKNKDINRISTADVDYDTYWKCLSDDTHPSYKFVTITKSKHDLNTPCCPYCKNKLDGKIDMHLKAKKEKEHKSDTYRIDTGNNTEIYFLNLLQKTNLFLDVTRTGSTTDKADIVVTLTDGSKKSLQIKTLSKVNDPNNDDVYVMNTSTKYNKNMLLVGANIERTRFCLEFAGNFNAISAELRFTTTLKKSKYEDIMYRNKKVFLDKLIESIPFSVDYNGPEMYETMIKEHNSIIRLEKRCKESGIDFKRNETNGNIVDCFVDGKKVQMKYSMFPLDGGYTYNAKVHKSCGKVNGTRVKAPLDIEDDFDYLIVEIGGDKQNPQKYHNYFITISKYELYKHGYIRSKKYDGKRSVSIAPHDYPKEHWTKQFWIHPHQKIVLPDVPKIKEDEEIKEIEEKEQEEQISSSLHSLHISDKQ
jgi:hypothetical protein